jgi:hypothetical protein
MTIQRIQNFFRRHCAFIAVFGVLYAVLLQPLLFGNMGFTEGDYELQFYPWASAFADALKEGRLPLWTPLIQSGFPLFAEGQTGMLYFPNLVLFGFLPFRVAYNAGFLLHFFLGGVFSYRLARSLGQSAEASTFSALAFTFGSAYAGCFYNIVTMRSLVWFPACLYLVDAYIRTRRLWPLALLSAATGLSWLAGFPQMAAYATGFTALYYALRAAAGCWGDLRLHAAFAASLAAGVLASVPQIWATLELAGHSTRTAHEASFVLWGSAAPWTALSLYFFTWSSFLGANLYVGVPALVATCLSAGRANARIWWLLCAVSVLMALGAFNPVYRLLVMLPGASLLRNPSKFLFFTAFFLSIISGFSWDALVERMRRGETAVLARRALSLCAAAGAIALAALAVVYKGAPALRAFGEWYVSTFVLGKSYHRHSPEYYAEKVGRILGALQSEIDPTRPIFWCPFVFLALSLAVAMWGARRPSRAVLCGRLILVLLAVDLAVFGLSRYGTGFRGNIGPFPDTAPVAQAGKWIDLTTEKNALPPPNKNFLSRTASPGAYSPLLDKDYYDFAKNFALLDDSFGRTSPGIEAFGEKNKLAFAGIRYAVLDRGAPAPEGWELAGGDERFLHYVNPAASPGYEWEGVGRGERTASSDESEVFVVESPDGGILTRNTVFDGGWKASINGRAVSIDRAHRAFQAVRVPAGRHEVRFEFKPAYWTTGMPLFFAVWVGIAGVWVVAVVKKVII